MANNIGSMRSLGEDPKPKPDPLHKARRNTGWMNNEAQKRHQKSQADYILPHVLEYKVDPRILEESIKPHSSAAPVVDQFDRVSTVVAPTEAHFDDYSSSLSADELRREFFSTYKRNTDTLIYKYRNKLLCAFDSYSVVIIEGATGCGKTTQVPCYILEDALLDRPNNPKAPVIYVTQPRRIAAKSVAKRVCDEHNWELGSIVGYQIGLEKKAGPKTAVTYCTSGVLLQKLIQDKSLANYTHIIIDEAHERDADTDLLMMMIRSLMREEKSFLRLLIMSATMQSNKLKEYFTFPAGYAFRSLTIPCLCVVSKPSESKNTTQVMFYDAVKSIFELPEAMPNFDIDHPELHDEMVTASVELIVRIIPQLDNYTEQSKSTLVFLPGLAEIIKLDKLLRNHQSELEIIPLHSTISSEQQGTVFDILPKGRRKVILATNIAESSITVKDVGFIIDFCLTKTLKKDPISKFPMLQLDWCSVDRCTQRGGRTGRCCNGKVFRMVSSTFFKEFHPYAKPELLTAPLELSTLRIKNFKMGEITSMFAVVIDPPKLDDIRAAVLELKQIGALSSTYKGKLSEYDGDLTELGKVISALPIDVHLSKLIVMASILDVMEPAIVIAACLSTNRSIVRNIYGDQLKSYQSKLDWSRGSYSDLFVCIDVYEQFAEAKDKEFRSKEALLNFCNNYNLDERKLYEVNALASELVARLEQINLKIIEQPNRRRDRLMDEFMLKIAICASFYPNYFLTEDLDVQDTKRALCGLDPTKTVVLHGLPVNQSVLYYSQIMEQIEEMKKYVHSDTKIDYIADCSRAILVFNSDHRMPKDESSIAVAGDILIPLREVERFVYLALKKAETNERFMIREFVNHAASERLKYYNAKRNNVSKLIPNRLLPSRLKVVRDREADNTRLLDSNDDEYGINMEEQFYVEVEIDDRYEESDRYWREQNNPNFKSDGKYLNGPTSPIGITFRPVLEKSKSHSVDVDPLSVNSILLNPDYEQPRRQMLVAASVCQSRGRILVRDTTLMPNIRGLPTLMSLLFAQYYKLLYNDKLKCIKGAVFGLGWDEKDKPIDKDYEVELGFDVQITQNDIDLINIARMEMSSLIRQLDVQNPGKPRAERQVNLRNILLKLLRKKRFPIQETNLDNIDWENGGFVLQKHNIPQGQVGPLEDGKTRAFLPVTETEYDYDERAMFIILEKNLDTINKICVGDEKVPLSGIRCLLCDTNSMILRSKIVAHVHTRLHDLRLTDFEEYVKLLKKEERSPVRNYSRDELYSMRPDLE